MGQHDDPKTSFNSIQEVLVYESNVEYQSEMIKQGQAKLLLCAPPPQPSLVHTDWCPVNIISVVQHV